MLSGCFCCESSDTIFSSTKEAFSEQFLKEPFYTLNKNGAE